MCYYNVLPSRIDVHKKHNLPLNSDVAGRKEANEAGKVFLRDIEAILSRRRVDCWSAPTKRAPL